MPCVFRAKWENLGAHNCELDIQKFGIKMFICISAWTETECFPLQFLSLFQSKLIFSKNKQKPPLKKKEQMVLYVSIIIKLFLVYKACKFQLFLIKHFQLVAKLNYYFLNHCRSMWGKYSIDPQEF